MSLIKLPRKHTQTHIFTYQIPDIAWLKRGGRDGGSRTRQEKYAYRNRERKKGKRKHKTSK